MPILETIALAITAVYLISRAVGPSGGKRVVIRYALIAAAGWTAEETCILAYGFYQYSPAWHLTVGQVPLLIAAVWPAVIQSAWDLAAAPADGGAKRKVFTGAAVVLTDALLIEPVAANAGLWSWNAPGIFGVPPIGIFGWGCFALLCLRVFYIDPPGTRQWGFWLLGPTIAVVGTHLLVVCGWWGILRWINVAVHPGLAAAAAWGGSLLMAWRILRRRTTGSGAAKKNLLWRLPAAAFVFSLLALHPGPCPYLAAYAAAFVPPYLVLMARHHPYRRSRVSGKR